MISFYLKYSVQCSPQSRLYALLFRNMVMAFLPCFWYSKTILANREIHQTRLPINVHLLSLLTFSPRPFNLLLNHIIHLLVSTTHQMQGHSVKHLIYLNKVVLSPPFCRCRELATISKKQGGNFTLKGGKVNC